MEFPLIKNLSDSRKKGKAEEENKEDLFCKSLAVDLKKMPLYEKLSVKNEIRGIAFKYQMSLLIGQASSSLQTEKWSQTIQGNSVPLGCPKINNPSALPFMPPSSSIQRPWRESPTNAQRGSNSGGFLSKALSNLPSPSSSGSWKETWRQTSITVY